MHTCSRTQTGTYTYAKIRIQSHAYICMHVYTHSHPYTQKPLSFEYHKQHSHVLAYTHTLIHAHTHTFIHTYMHRCTFVDAPLSHVHVIFLIHIQAFITFSNLLYYDQVQCWGYV